MREPELDMGRSGPSMGPVGSVRVGLGHTILRLGGSGCVGSSVNICNKYKIYTQKPIIRRL